MSVQSKLTILVNNIITSINNLDSYIGDLSSLPTTNKTSLVSSLTELKNIVDLKATIIDGTTSLSSTWSSSKIFDEISQAIADLIDGSPSVLNTLKELANALHNNPDIINDLLLLIGTKQDFIPYGSTNEFFAWDKTWKPVTKSMIGLNNVTNDAQIRLADLDTDPLLTSNSDSKVTSQKAIKSYVDNHNWDGGFF